MTVLESQEQDAELSRWDLSALLPEPSEEATASALAELEHEVQAFEGQRPSLESGIDPPGLLDLVRRYEAIVEKMSVLGAYASLRFASDTQSQAALTYRNRIQQNLTSLGNRVLFFTLWWKSLDEEQAHTLLPNEEESPDYAFFLQDLRRFRPFSLDERSEQIINTKNADGIDAVLTLYSMLTNRLEFTLTVGGQPQTLTRDRLMSYAYSPQPELREAAYRELYRVYEGESKILGQMYVNRVRDWHNELVELRGHPSPIAARNLFNDLPDGAVDTLLQVTQRNVGLFQRYFRLKASWLGQDRLRRHDLYAPLQASEIEIPYGEAVNMTLETFAAFHPKLGEKARQVFDQRRIDSEIRHGKKGGAFCMTVLPRLTPWVLVNYTGRARDVAALAHELGHAVHSMMAENHSVLTQQPTLPLAETASVFAEMLVTGRLLAEQSDRAARRELLAGAVDDMYATVMRQAYFVLFELAAHEAIREGRSPEELADLYLRNLQDQFGDSVEIGPQFRHEWLTIPHIYATPFYCYAYSFGQLLVLALYRRYQEEGEGFKPTYLKLLSCGGSGRPQKILEEAGIDATDPGFWQTGFDMIQGMIDQLASLS